MWTKSLRNSESPYKKVKIWQTINHQNLLSFCTSDHQNENFIFVEAIPVSGKTATTEIGSKWQKINHLDRDWEKWERLSINNDYLDLGKNEQNCGLVAWQMTHGAKQKQKQKLIRKDERGVGVWNKTPKGNFSENFFDKMQYNPKTGFIFGHFHNFMDPLQLILEKLHGPHPRKGNICIDTIRDWH